MYTLEDIKAEIRQAITQGEDLEEISGRDSEFIDGFMPIYNNQIIAEWQAMPSEYDNQGSEQLGYREEYPNIINLMSLDLYIYYSELFQEALKDIEAELEEQEGE